MPIIRYPRASPQPGGPRHQKHKYVPGRPCNNGCGQPSINWANYYLCRDCVRASKRRNKRRLQTRKNLNPPHVRGCLACGEAFVSIRSNNTCPECRTQVLAKELARKRLRLVFPHPRMRLKQKEILCALQRWCLREFGCEPRTIKPKREVTSVLAQQSAWDKYRRMNGNQAPQV